MIDDFSLNSRIQLGLVNESKVQLSIEDETVEFVRKSIGNMKLNFRLGLPDP